MKYSPFKKELIVYFPHFHTWMIENNVQSAKVLLACFRVKLRRFAFIFFDYSTILCIFKINSLWHSISIFMQLFFLLSPSWKIYCDFLELLFHLLRKQFFRLFLLFIFTEAYFFKNSSHNYLDCILTQF